LFERANTARGFGEPVVAASSASNWQIYAAKSAAMG
jgi:hypothetical protein